jgi:hypothetical protein
VPPRVPYLGEAVQEHHRSELACESSNTDNKLISCSASSACSPTGRSPMAAMPNRREALTCAYLSNVKVEPADGELGVLYQLHHCCFRS